MRVRKKPWAEEELQNNPHVVKEIFEKKGHWSEYFGNNNPIYVEIGCGKGGFILKNAVQNKEINFIGIERQSSVIAVAARKIGNNLPNLALICGDAIKLEELFECREVKRLYINFCDPWPKKRNRKRRLTYRGFLKNYESLLGEKGEVFFKTDNRDLFEFSLNEFCAEDWKLSNITLDLHQSETVENNIMTEYEAKFSQKGMPIYRLEARVREK